MERRSSGPIICCMRCVTADGGDDGEVTPLVVNTGAERQGVTITGLPDGVYQHLRLSENEMLAAVDQLERLP